MKIHNVKIEEYLPHFIRGVFDGDGSISGNDISHVQFTIGGNKPFLEQIQNILIKGCSLNKVKIYPATKGNSYRLQYAGSQIFKILNFIYKDSKEIIKLKRKYDKYTYFKNKFANN